MRINKTIYAIGMGLLVCGCATNDDPFNGQGEGNHGGTGHYVNLSLVTDSSTRAGEFANGSESESKINSVGLYFFDIYGTCVFTKLLAPEPGSFTTAGASASNPSVEVIGNLEVELEANADYHSVVAIVNPDAALMSGDKESLIEMDLENLKKYQASYSGAKTEGYTMSNSVYYEDDDLISATEGEPLVATPIYSGNIYIKNTPSDPIPEGSAIDIYVERTCAKVSVPTDIKTAAYFVSQEGNVITRSIEVIGKDGAMHTITIKPNFVGMALSVTTTKGNVIKSLSGLSKTLRTSSPKVEFDWNDPANKRSYWEATTYRDASSLSYTSWNTVSGNRKTSSYTAYVNPNTMQYYNFKTDKQDRSTKLIVCAQLKYYEGEEVADEENVETKALPLVRFSGGYWMAQYFLEYSVNRVLENLVNLPLPDSFTTQEATQATAVLAKMNPDKMAETISLTSKNPDSRVTAYLAKVVFDDKSSSSNAADRIDIFEGTGITDDLKAKLYPVVKADIESVLGAITDRGIEYWKDGMTYFYVPIRHTGFGDLLKVTTNNANETIDFLNAVVRNHVYDVTINSIVGLGTPVIDPTKGIDPERPDDAPDSYLNANIHSLKWRVSSSNVTVH